MLLFKRQPFVTLVISVLAEGFLLTDVAGSSNVVNTDDVEQFQPRMLEIHEELHKGIFERSAENSGKFSSYFQGEDLSACTKCGRINSKKGNFMIIQGDAVDVHYKYPWMVRLSSKSFCGGSIISANYILTAAHCVQGIGPKDLNIFFLTNTSSVARGPRVQQIIRHPEYKPPSLNDIALLKLKTKIICDTFKNPICLPPPNKKIPVGTVVTIAGWGATKPGPRAYPRELQDGKAKLVDYSRCAKTYGKRNVKFEYCFDGLEGKWQSACNGDSGGPAFYESNGKYYQVGVATSAIVGCKIGYPFMYADVPSYVNWINEVMKKGSP